MPYVECRIREGVEKKAKQQLVTEIAEILHEVLGSPYEYIHVGIVEIPGEQFIESGKINFPYTLVNSL